MKSPFTGKDMTIVRSEQELTYRKEKFEVVYHSYYCKASKEYFTDKNLDELNILQAHNAYRVKHQLPFSDEIRQIREQYAVSTTKMAEILGFGINVYRQYEQGEMPNESNARLIQLAANPSQFEKLTLLSDAFKSKGLEEIQKRIEVFSREKEPFSAQSKMLLDAKNVSQYNGYTPSNLSKMQQMAIFFADQTKPYKTKLNKLLFYADFGHYKKKGRSISGAAYRAVTHGPVPSKFELLFSYFTEKDIIKIQYIDINPDVQGEQFLASENVSFNETLFDHSEIETLKEVVAKFGKMGNPEIIKKSHEETAWLANQEQKLLIDYKYAFDLKHI